MSVQGRVTDLKASVVYYDSPDGPCTGTNLLYKVDGRRCSSRVPYVVSDPQQEVARLERLLERIKQ